MTRKKKPEDAPTPIYPKGPSQIPLDSIFRFLGLLRKHGQTSQFRWEAEEAEAFIVADPQTVKFIKDFVAARPDMYGNPLGARVIRPKAAEIKTSALAADQGQHRCIFCRKGPLPRCEVRAASGIGERPVIVPRRLPLRSQSLGSAAICRCAGCTASTGRPRLYTPVEESGRRLQVRLLQSEKCFLFVRRRL